MFTYANRDPTLPIDVKYNLFDIEGNDSEQRNVCCRACNCDLHEIKHYIKRLVKTFVRHKKKQRLNYNRRHQVSNKIEVGQKVYLKNQSRMDRKGGIFSFK